MSSLLHQLENNEAVLLLYLAGEMPAEDRAEVEQLLTGDAGLRHELEALRHAENRLTLALSEADGLAMPPVTQSAKQAAAVRRVSRAMVKFQIEQRQNAVVQELQIPPRALRLPSWSYPFATAAMILIGWVAYWGFTAGGPSHRVRPEVAESFPEDYRFDGGTMPNMLPEEMGPRRFASLPSMGVEEGDMDLVAISVGSYDVSSMFQPEKE